MKNNTRHSILVNKAWQWLFIASLLCVFTLPAQAAIPDNVDYQGYLTDSGGSPVNGTVSVTFSLYNIDTGGIALWTDTQSVTLTNGLFNVKLGRAGNPFPLGLFDAPLWLGIDVASDGEMSPRVAMSSAGFAHKANDADTIGGVSIGGLATSSELAAHTTDNTNPHTVTAVQVGSPTSANFALHTGDASAHHNKTTSFSELSDQASDAQLPTTIARDSEIMPTVLTGDGPGSTLNADLLDGNDSSAFANALHAHNGSVYGKVAVVAKSGGDYVSPLDAMFNLATWCGIPSASNPCLLRIMPGVYNLGNNALTMQPYVDIEGSGESTTTISSTHSAASFDVNSATVVGANNAEIRFINLENLGGGTYAFAIYNNAASPKITNVSALASGGSLNYGVFNMSAASPTMTNMVATASGGTTSYAVANTGSSPKMINVTAMAVGGTNFSHGVNNASSSSPTMTNVVATASGGTTNRGIYNWNSSSPKMTNVSATATGGTFSTGIYNSTSSPSMANIKAAASAGINNYGVYNSGASVPVMMSVAATASGGTTNYGVYNASIASPSMNDVSSNGIVINGNQLFVPASSFSASANGLRLLSVANEIAGLGAPSASNPYVIKLDAGVYDLGNNAFVMMPYVDIEGSGEHVTTITSANNITLVGKDNTELRFLTIENRGGATNSTAVDNFGTSPKITNVTLMASGGLENRGIRNTNASKPVMTNVTILVTGGDVSYGVHNNSGSPILENVSVTVSGGVVNFGMFNESTFGSPIINNVTFTITGGSFGEGIHNSLGVGAKISNITIDISGVTGDVRGIYSDRVSPSINNASIQVSACGRFCTGIFNTESSAMITDVSITSIGGEKSWGIYNLSSTPVISNVSVSATGGSVASYGVINRGISTLTIKNSTIIGETNSVYNDDVFPIANIANSMLDGAIFGVGFTCIGAHNNAFVALGSGCL